MGGWNENGETRRRGEEEIKETFARTECLALALFHFYHARDLLLSRISSCSSN